MNVPLCRAQGDKAFVWQAICFMIFTKKGMKCTLLFSELEAVGGMLNGISPFPWCVHLTLTTDPMVGGNLKNRITWKHLPYSVENCFVVCEIGAYAEVETQYGPAQMRLG